MSDCLPVGQVSVWGVDRVEGLLLFGRQAASNRGAVTSVGAEVGSSVSVFVMSESRHAIVLARAAEHRVNCRLMALAGPVLLRAVSRAIAVGAQKRSVQSPEELR